MKEAENPDEWEDVEEEPLLLEIDQMVSKMLEKQRSQSDKEGDVSFKMKKKWLFP